MHVQLNRCRVLVRSFNWRQLSALKLLSRDPSERKKNFLIDRRTGGKKGPFGDSDVFIWFTVLISIGAYVGDRMDDDGTKKKKELRSRWFSKQKSPTGFRRRHVTYVACSAKCNLITASDVRWESWACWINRLKQTFFFGGWINKWVQVDLT